MSALKFIVGNYQDEEIQKRILEALEDEISSINSTLNVGFGVDGVVVSKDPIWEDTP